MLSLRRGPSWQPLAPTAMLLVPLLCLLMNMMRLERDTHRHREREEECKNQVGYPRLDCSTSVDAGRAAIQMPNKRPSKSW